MRYRLSADAVFAWEGAQHDRLQGEGITRDISLAGAFIFTSTCPPVGSTVQLDVFLPPILGAAGKRVRIRTSATVLRIENSAGSKGFAAVSEDFKLLFDSKGRNAVSVSSSEKTHRREKAHSASSIRKWEVDDSKFGLV